MCPAGGTMALMQCLGVEPVGENLTLCYKNKKRSDASNSTNIDWEKRK